jgi:cell surface protein SprA
LVTDYQEFNQNFTQVTNKMFKATANVDLFPDLKIDLTADRSYSRISRQYNVLDGQYSLSYTYGLFSISTVLIKHRSQQVMKFLLQHLMTLELTGL